MTCDLVIVVTGSTGRVLANRLSVGPAWVSTTVNGYTNAPTLLIAEEAADLSATNMAGEAALRTPISACEETKRRCNRTG